MPVTKSAKKALRSSEKKRVFNLRRKNKITDAKRNLGKLLAATEVKKDLVNEALGEYYSSLDKAVKGNFIPKARSSRLKSRMATKVSKSLGEFKPEFLEKRKARVRVKPEPTLKKAKTTTTKKAEPKPKKAKEVK